MTVKQILLLRHGQTAWNTEYRYQGRTDVALNDKGCHQARLTAPRIAAWNPDGVWVSPLQRAKTTALLASGWDEDRLIITDKLSEIQFGCWEGMLRDEVERQWGNDFYRWGQDPESYTPDGGESYLEVRHRVGQLLQEVVASPCSRCLLVAHGGSLRALLSVALDLPSCAAWRFRLSNCSLTGLELWRGNVWLSFLNDYLHLHEKSGDGKYGFSEIFGRS